MVIDFGRKQINYRTTQGVSVSCIRRTPVFGKDRGSEKFWVGPFTGQS